MEYSEEIISDSLFQLDALLPAQYLETVCSTIHPEGEKKLMLAVLEDAISCFQNYISTKDKWEEIQFCEAEEWIFAQDDNDFHFSFVSICEALGLNPSYIREGLLRWRYHRLGKRNRFRFGVNRSRYSSRYFDF
jgi:hypothetical protein